MKNGLRAQVRAKLVDIDLRRDPALLARLSAKAKVIVGAVFSSILTSIVLLGG